MKYIPLAASPFLLLSSCTQAELQDTPMTDIPVELIVTAAISPVSTRATVSTTSFQDGDKIGLFSVDGSSGVIDDTQINLQYEYSANTNRFTSGTPFYFRNTSEVSLYAYYPYQSGLTSSDYLIPIDTRAYNQGDDVTFPGTTWRMNDYLYACAYYVSVTNPYVQFDFWHGMSLVHLTFKADPSAGVPDLSLLTGYEITTGLIMDGTFDPTHNQISADNSAPKESLNITIGEEVDLTGEQEYSQSLILLPQNVSSGNKIEFTVYYAGKQYVGYGSLPPGNSFHGGESSVYTITISDTELTVTGSEIPWTTGSSANGVVILD